MSVFVVNEPILLKANGEPFLFVGPECYECGHEQRFHVTREDVVDCRHRLGDSREAVCGCDTFLSGEGLEYSLAQWVAFFMDNLPVGHLRNVDGRRLRAVQDACEAVKPEGVIEFADDQYDWLMDILFDDTEGQRIRAKAGEPSSTQPSGPWTTNIWTGIAVAAERALQRRVKGPDDLTLVGDDEDKVRTMPQRQAARPGKRASGRR